jgi:hypothetical protein
MALIQIFSASEGGRSTPAFNGIRWDFSYASDQATDTLFMIHPDFYDVHEDSLAADVPLPTGIELPARMVVLADEMREKVHRDRIQVGTTFYCHEGQKRVGQGRVLRVTNLFLPRAKG